MTTVDFASLIFALGGLGLAHGQFKHADTLPAPRTRFLANGVGWLALALSAACALLMMRVL